jgi:hypothetical protein
MLWYRYDIHEIFQPSRGDNSLRNTKGKLKHFFNVLPVILPSPVPWKMRDGMEWFGYIAPKPRPNPEH